MTRLTTILRSTRARLLLVPVLVTAVFAVVLTAGAATVIPVPDALVVVKTKSGTFERTSLVPIGGAPIPIDVDGPSITGLLEPDIDVSVGLVAIDELPDKPIVPNVVIRRNALALTLGRKAPPLEIDAKVVLRDANDGLKPLVEVHYGYSTPAGSRIPPVVSAKLVGPVQGGFVDPLVAKIDSPGYSGPLDLHVSALTDDLDAKFELGFDALPEAIFVSEDPREDGLDALYTHSAPVADVHLDAKASLRNRATNELMDIGANVERLPQRIALATTSTADSTLLTYDSSSVLSKPDLEATFRDTDGAGTVKTDAQVAVAGLPLRMRGQFDTVLQEGKRTIDKVDFAVLDGEEIESVDFVARDYIGPAGNVPAPQLGPDQFVAVSTRPQPDGSARFRAAGRLLGVRSAIVERQGPANDILDARTDVGNGVKPLRAVLDLDDRAPGAGDDAKRMKVDATVTPLPRTIHTVFDPSSSADDPIKLLYESSSTVDVDVDAIIAQGPADGCGQAQVTCAKARVDKIPGRLEAKLPAEGGTDFRLSHDGGSSQRPDVRATVDTTDAEAVRTWADVRILRVPNEVTGRLDTKLGVLKAAEFHGCTWDFTAGPPACTDTQGALGRVSFTVRDQPDRGTLPPRPDTARQFVTLLKRDARFEAAGSVDEVRHVAFRQRDADADGEADGTLGALVDAGTSAPFDVEIDDLSDVPDPDDTTEPITILGKGSTKMSIGVAALPQRFSACVRESAEVAPPAPGSLPADDLLAPCDRDDVLGRSSGELDVTPLSILYTASSPTKVDARIEAEAPDKDDKITATTFHRSADVFATTVDAVPDELRADVIPPVTPDPAADPAVAGRKLEMHYDASERISRIDFEMQARRATSICEDPRPNRRATCLSAVVTDLPDDVSVSYDPDDSKGDIEFVTAPPKESGGGSCSNGGDDDGDGQNDASDPDCVRLSVNKDDASIPDPMRLSIVEPDPTSQPLVLDARIKDISDHLKGKLVSKDVDGEGGLGPSKCANGVDDDGDSGDSGGGIDGVDDDCEKDMARLSFNACPDGPCAGIGEIRFKATNALIGDPLPQPSPLTTSIPGVTQDFSFIQREDLFRAQGVISKLKRIGLAQVDDSPQQNPSATTRIEAAFGSGLASEKIRAYVDTDSGAEQLLADAVIAQAPAGINLCLRDAIPGGSDFTSDGGSAIYCDTAPNDQLAMQVALDEAAGGAKPDIDLRQLRMASGGGTSLITGDAQVDNLGERIDILVGKQAKDGDIQIEGQQLGDDNSVPVTSDPDNVAGRVTFNLRNRAVAPTGLFPWNSLENSDANPSNNTTDVEAVAAGNDGNYLKFFTDAAGRFIARGSVPDIKRIAKRTGPCETDARFPTSGYPATKVPEYSCLNAVVAGDQKLGLAVRTLDAANEVLQLEEGHVTSVPSGGLQVTLAKSPDAAGLDPVCTDPQTAFPCRPPMLSLEAPRGGAAVPHLRARLSTGSKDLIVNKMMGQVADDAISKQLNYEQAPKDFAEAGARVKVGTDQSPSGKELLGIRMNADLPLHQFLDLDPPTLWSCKHDDDHPDPNPATDCSAPDNQASSDKNEGYESKDIFFKLVAADNHHDGSDVPFLGRIAVLVQDYKSGGTQTVLTGAPGQAGNPALPDNSSWFKDRAGTDFEGQASSDPVTGADSRFPENFASASDPSNRGFRVPGHLDAKVYLRNDYEAPGDDDKQQNFAQVDGRVNAPLTMAVRLNDGTVSNRAGQAVPPTQLTLRNAPGTNGSDDYAQPSFRVRAELKKGHVDQTPPNLAEKIFTCDGAGYGIQIPALLTVCLLVPTQAQAQWLDVALNMDPNSNGNTTTGNPARTVDAVAGPFGGSNDADLRGFAQVNGSGGDVSKGAGAGIVPQAGLRLTNFNIGLKVGAGIGLIGGSATWVEEGDLIVGLTGHQSERARLNHNLLVMRLSGGTEANPNRINSNLKSIFRFKVTVEALFGLVEGDVINETIGPFHHDIIFRDCLGSFLALGGTADQFISPSPDLLSNQKAAIAFGSTGDIVGDVAASFNNVLTGIGSQIFCLFSTSDSKDVNAGHPAPRYSVSQRGVENGPGAAAGAAPADPPAVSDDVGRKDLTIDAGTPVAERTRCGTIVAKKLTVAAGVTLRVGREGETDGVNGGACAGRLNVDAQDVEIDGTIDAVGARTTTNGPGTPGGSGGGAGHHGTGGAAGSGSGGGAAAPGPSTNPLEDFGSAGANGSGGVAGGRGGGAVQIASITDIVVDGAILARGSAGAGAPAACSNVGAGGGSGGAIALTGTRVVGTGTISVTGGSGGSAARGGGGGSAGRVTVNSVVKGGTGSLFFGNAGSGASGLADCGAPAGVDSGAAGSTGPGGPAVPPLGTTLDRAAGAFLHSDNPGPFVQGTAKIVVKGVQQVPSGDPDAGPMDIVLCRKYLAPENTVGPFEDPALDNGETPVLDDLLDEDACTGVEFSSPNVGNTGYQDTVTVNLPQDGFYSWYAIAAQRPDLLGSPISDPDYCTQTHSGSFFDPQCDYQSVDGSGGEDDVILPKQVSIRLGSDTVAPAYDTAAANRPLNGVAGCPDGSLCLADATAKLKIETSDRTSGVKSSTCTVTGGPAGSQLCPEGASINVDVGLNDGLKAVNLRLEDNADSPPATSGNVNNVSPAATWFTDRTKPNKPVVTLGACGGGQNGWCTSIPSISATASDGNPSSGFPAGSLSILIDEAGSECGGEAAGSSSGAGTTGITCPAGTVAATTEGRHAITAIATDRLGNESARADTKTMKVDTTDPKSDVFLGPKKPDGNNGWYRTRPFVAFGATDKAGGSGVDRSVDPSGIFYAIDGGTSGAYQPSDFVEFNPEADIRLTDGVHEICWYAVDVAGNDEASGDPKGGAAATNCKANIKVDAVAPDAQDPIAPPTPDGTNSFYVVTPTINGTATDPQASGVNQVAGIDRVEQQFDDEGWTAAAPRGVAEGEHVIRTRAFDVAGNPSAILERTVRVDRSNPSAALVTFPPRPNDQGWFRKRTINAIAVGDGRDGSGPDGATFSIDGSGPSSYLEPFPVSDGDRTVAAQARDRAGRQGATVTRGEKIDTLIPLGTPSGQSASLLLNALIPSPTKLRFSASDQLGPRVKVRVFVYNELGVLVRRLSAAGPYAGGYRDPGSGYVEWNGRNESNQGVLAGVYHYRVHVTDQAGNTLLSPESPTFLVVLGLLPRNLAAGGRPDAIVEPQRTTAPAPVAATATVKAADVIALPAARSCVARKRLAIALRLPKALRATGAEVFVGKQRVRRVTGKGLASRVTLRDLPRRAFTLKVTVRVAGGRSISVSRRYGACSGRRR